MGTRELKQFCELDEATKELLKNAMADLNLSARAYDRILKVARTIADLAGVGENSQRPHFRGDSIPLAGPAVVGVTWPGYALANSSVFFIFIQDHSYELSDASARRGPGRLFARRIASPPPSRRIDRWRVCSRGGQIRLATFGIGVATGLPRDSAAAATVGSEKWPGSRRAFG